MARGTAVVVKDALLQIRNIDFNTFVDILREEGNYETADQVPMLFAKQSWGIFSENPYQWFLIVNKNMRLIFTEKLMQLREQSKTTQG